MEIKCKFSIHKEKNPWCTDPYTCQAQEISKPSLEKEIKAFNGKHEAGKTKNHVKWLNVKDQPIGFFPRNLHKVFPNLKYLTMMGCGIEELSREDLKGLEDLEYIDCGNNKLTTLPDDLFADMKNLRWIYFDDNRLERLSSKLLLPIEQTLTFANFAGNKRINEWFDENHKKNNDLAKFMRSIDSNCLPPRSQADRMLEEIAKFKISGEFTDFTLKVRGKEFKIHKNIFAAQSSVFRKIFTEDVKEATTSLNKIKNFSEKTFEQFFDYFYTGRVDASANATEMFELASEFDVPEVKIICSDRIVANLDESNAVDIFNLAHRHSADKLKQKSFEVIKKMFKMFPEMDATFVNKLDEVNELMASKAQMKAKLEKK